jgi:hypothetical protein
MSPSSAARSLVATARRSINTHGPLACHYRPGVGAKGIPPYYPSSHRLFPRPKTLEAGLADVSYPSVAHRVVGQLHALLQEKTHL